ncbi:MAG: hypothetical protein KAW39_00950 [Thermoplasmata archaeon]|nr:hypothetical protein [Thermoplasmata archaeon]
MIEHTTPSGERIVLGPKGEHDSEGHVFLTLIDDVVDSAKAKRIAQEIVQDVLVENFLILDGRSLGSSGMSFSDPELVNEAEVENRKKTGYATLAGNVIICAPLDASRIRKAFTLHQRRFTLDKRDEIDRCVKWLKKGHSLSDPVDQFLMYWISFNVLYGLLSDRGKQTDRVSINELLNGHPREKESITHILNKHGETVDILAGAELTDWHERTSYSEKLQESLKTDNYRDQLKKVALCLYVVRNQVFHGGRGLLEARDFYIGCSSLLFDLLRTTITSYAENPRFSCEI